MFGLVPDLHDRLLFLVHEGFDLVVNVCAVYIAAGSFDFLLNACAGSNAFGGFDFVVSACAVSLVQEGIDFVVNARQFLEKMFGLLISTSYCKSSWMVEIVCFQCSLFSHFQSATSSGPGCVFSVFSLSTASVPPTPKCIEVSMWS